MGTDSLGHVVDDEAQQQITSQHTPTSLEDTSVPHQGYTGAERARATVAQVVVEGTPGLRRQESIGQANLYQLIGYGAQDIVEMIRRIPMLGV